MSTQLEDNLRDILSEKTTKIIPENIKDGVEIFDVTGTYKPTPNIYTQTTEPTGKDGIWVKSNVEIENIYCDDDCFDERNMARQQSFYYYSRCYL